MNIAMPVFSIHGNHDDPSGLGGFSCLDSLHSTGLINYFGRINNLEEVSGYMLVPAICKAFDNE